MKVKKQHPQCTLLQFLTFYAHTITPHTQTQHLLEHSIERQYNAFESGFLRLCNGHALSWFRYRAGERDCLRHGRPGSSAAACVCAATPLLPPLLHWLLPPHTYSCQTPGFHQLRRPQELELLACGGQQLDLEALEAATLHTDGYTRDSEVSCLEVPCAHQCL